MGLTLVPREQYLLTHFFQRPYFFQRILPISVTCTVQYMNILLLKVRNTQILRFSGVMAAENPMNFLGRPFQNYPRRPKAADGAAFM